MLITYNLRSVVACDFDLLKIAPISSFHQVIGHKVLLLENINLVINCTG